MSEEEKAFIMLHAGHLTYEEMAKVLTEMANYKRTPYGVHKYALKLGASVKKPPNIFVLLPRDSFEDYKTFVDAYLRGG